MVKFGGLLVILSVVLLGVSLVPIFMPDNDSVLDFYQPFLCAPGETLTVRTVVTQDYDGTGYSGDFDCIRANETSYDVTAKATIYGIVAFVVPFLIGLFMLIIGFNRNMRGVVQQSAWGVNVPNNPMRFPMSGINMQGMNPPPAPSQMYNFDTTTANAPSKSELTARLEQLQNAYNAGLITSDEYNTTRANLLRDFANVDLP